MAANDIKTSAATELAAGNSSAATEHTGEPQLAEIVNQEAGLSTAIANQAVMAEVSKVQQEAENQVHLHRQEAQMEAEQVIMKEREAMAAAAQESSANQDTVFNPKTPQMVEARKLMTELLRPIMTSRGFDQEQALQWVQAVKEGKIPIKKSEEDTVTLVLETAEAAQELAKEMRTPTAK